MAVVDFSPKAFYVYTNVKKFLLRDDLSMHWNDAHMNVLGRCEEKVRLEIAKEYLNEWNLLSKLDEAYQEIVLEKDKMKQHGIDFKVVSTPTEELEKYISVVKENLRIITELLNTNE